MTYEEIEALALKIKNRTATEEEQLSYYEELNKGADEVIAILESMSEVTE